MNSDLTARARLRDATISLVADGETPTARTVAARADVSVGLIRHHFGTMAGLLEACDEHIASLVRDVKHDQIRGPIPNVFATLQAAGEQRVMSYLAHRLTESSQAIDALVDQVAADAARYWQEAIDAGLARPVADLVTAARMSTLYALGTLVLHKQLQRLLDIDITAPDLASQPGLAAYIRVQFDLFGGLLKPDVVEQYTAQLQAAETPKE